MLYLKRLIDWLTHQPQKEIDQRLQQVAQDYERQREEIRAVFQRTAAAVAKRGY